MKDIYIIVGAENSGKTDLAKALAKQINPREIVILNGKELEKRLNNSFAFSACSKNTDVILIDDVPNYDLIKYLSIQEFIYVNKKLLTPFYITPMIITTINREIIPDEFYKSQLYQRSRILSTEFLKKYI